MLDKFLLVFFFGRLALLGILIGSLYDKEYGPDSTQAPLTIIAVGRQASFVMIETTYGHKPLKRLIPD